MTLGFTGYPQDQKSARADFPRRRPPFGSMPFGLRPSDYSDMKAYWRDRNHWQRHRIMPDEYAILLSSQCNRCAICRELFTPGKKKYLDHDHETGVIRGILCGRCNSALGALHDSLLIAQNAAHYLANPPAVKVLGERKVNPVFQDRPGWGNIAAADFSGWPKKAT